jgi:hypothetical protein
VFIVVGCSLEHARQLCCSAKFSPFVICDVRTCDLALAKPSLVVGEGKLCIDVVLLVRAVLTRGSSNLAPQSTLVLAFDLPLSRVASYQAAIAQRRIPLSHMLQLYQSAGTLTQLCSLRGRP